jgi:glutathione S-transferase
VERIDALWTECRELHRANGPWLFGAGYTVADAMYAPVALRFATYGARLTSGASEYLVHVLSDPHLRDWIQAARDEVAHEGRPMEHG